MHVFVAAAPLESSAESAPSESREEGKWVTIGIVSGLREKIF